MKNFKPMFLESTVNNKFEAEFRKYVDVNNFADLFLSVLGKCTMTYTYGEYDYDLQKVLVFKINEYVLFEYFIESKCLVITKDYTYHDTEAFGNMCRKNYRISEKIKELFMTQLGIDIYYIDVIALEYTCTEEEVVASEKIIGLFN